MNELVLRQLRMLQMVPRAPRKISTTEIQQRLASRGHDINIRSIQRDLITLSTDFSLICDDVHRPHGWSFHPDAALVGLPHMDPQAALAFTMLERHLRGALPSETLRALQPHLHSARTVLQNGKGRKLKEWLDRVRVMPRAMPSTPPQTVLEAVAVVYDALWTDRRFTAWYKRRGEKKAEEHEINPLALVLRDAVTYLVCTFYNYTDVRLIALHRLVRAEPLPQKRTVPAGFDLDNWLAGGALGFSLSETPIKLRLRLTREAAVNLLESPVGQDQVLVAEDDDHVTVSVTVQDTQQTMGWLLSYGPAATVLGPAVFRRRVAKALAQAALAYQEEVVVPPAKRRPAARRKALRPART